MSWNTNHTDGLMIFQRDLDDDYEWVTWNTAVWQDTKSYDFAGFYKVFWVFMTGTRSDESMWKARIPKDKH